MARPFQLRYNDANNGETVIGTYLKDDNLLDDGMLKNSGSGEYTRLEVKGDKQLKNNIEIDYSNYGTARNGESEPEILVYEYEKSTGNWVLRDRVFPEKAGVIDDKGNYTNDELWGFQKWVGRQKVSNISKSNASITSIVDALLPSGYTAQTPSGDSVPTQENYSFTGKIDRALRDIVRDNPVKIWFTHELDGNNDIIVKVQSKGYGGVEQSVTFNDERQTSGYQIVEFDEEDKSNIVNKVEVEGVDSNGNKISTVKSDSNSISKHGERYIHRNVGYLDSSTQADNIADNILSPDASPHAKISVGFIEGNALNASIDVTDNRYGIDAVYTIVVQRTFYTDSKTEVELGFEKNEAESRRNNDRDLDERNHQLFPTNTTDAGQQSFTGDTGSAPSKTGVTGSINKDGGGQINADAEQKVTQTNLDSSSWTDITGSTTITPNADSQGCFISVTVLAEDGSLNNSYYYQVKLRIKRNGSVILPNDGSSFPQFTYYQKSGTNAVVGSTSVTVQDQIADSENIVVEAQLVNSTGYESSTPFPYAFVTTYHFSDLHTHTDNFDTSDDTHGGTNDTTGQHGASGTTDSKNIDVTTKEDTNR